MKRATLRVLLALLAAVCLAGSATAAEFQADMSISGAQAINGKIFVKGKNFRMDMGQGETASIVITKAESNETYVCNEATKMCMKSIQVGPEFSNFKKDLPEDQMKKVGSETLEGFKTTKYEVSTPEMQGGKTLVWVADALDYPIKSEHKGPMGEFSQVLKNIKKGGVSDSMFQLPAGYQVMQMPEIPNMGQGQDQGQGK